MTGAGRDQSYPYNKPSPAGGEGSGGGGVGVADHVVPVQDQDGTAEETQVRHGHAVVNAELGVAIGREERVVAHALGLSPTLERKGQVNADGDDINVVQLGRFLVKADRLGVTDAGVYGRYEAQNTHLRPGIAQADFTHVGVHQEKVRRLVADLQLASQECDRCAAPRHCANSFCYGHRYASSSSVVSLRT